MAIKLIGYILVIIGILILASSSFPQISETIPLIKSIPDLYNTIVSIGLVIIGLVFILKSGGNASIRNAELPIFQGRRVVGYRRH